MIRNHTAKLRKLCGLTLSAIVLLTGGCYYRSSPGAGSTNVVKAATLTTNVLDGRVDAYDAALDYFPDKAAFRLDQIFRALLQPRSDINS
jgi:hypothetical protein